MRELIAKEKGDQDPWDLKLARGGLTDLDFLAQELVLAKASRHATLVGLSTPATFHEAARLGLMPDPEARRLADAYRLIDDIHQWQRLTIEGRFDEATAPASILKRLAAVAGQPSAEVWEYLEEVRRGMMQL